MVKDINFPPYTEAEIKGITENGYIICDLYGPHHSDVDICFEPESQVLGLDVFELEYLRELFA